MDSNSTSGTPTGVQSGDWLGSVAFCPCCNYAVTKLEIEYVRMDFECSHCANKRLSQYYSAGSDTHRKNIGLWKNGHRITVSARNNSIVKILPPPYWPNTQISHAPQSHE